MICDASVGGDIALIEAREEFMIRMQNSLRKRSSSEMAATSQSSTAQGELMQAEVEKKTLLKVSGK